MREQAVMKERWGNRWPRTDLLFFQSMPRKFVSIVGFIFLSLNGHAADGEAGPVVEVDEAMLQRARSRIENRVEPFWSYWSQAKADAAKALDLAPGSGLAAGAPRSLRLGESRSGALGRDVSRRNR